MVQLDVRKLLAAGQVSEATEFDRKNLVAAGGKIVAAMDEFIKAKDTVDGDQIAEADGLRRNALILVLFGLFVCAGLRGHCRLCDASRNRQTETDRL